jgi:alpha-N-acetylglucosamine transferase
MIQSVATLISGGQGFFLGVIGQKGLLNKYSKLPHVVMVEDGSYPDKHIAYLEKIGSNVKIVPPIRTQKTNFAAKRWPKTFTKLNLWSLIEYEHILFLDADAYPYAPIDDLFKSIKPDFLGATTFAKNVNRFRSGMMVVKPNKNRMHELLEYIQKDPAKIQAKLGDQGVLNCFVNHHLNGEFVKICYHWHTVVWPKRPKNVIIGHVRPKPWAENPKKLPGYKASIQLYINKWKEAKREIIDNFGDCPSL